MNFRVATAADLPDLLELLSQDDLGKTRESETALAAYDAAFAAIEADPNASILVAELDSVIIGCAQLNTMVCLSHQGAKRGQIENVRINSAYRGQGFGRELLEACTANLTKAGCRILQLMSDKQREEAIGFYKECGFEATHEGFKKIL